MSAPTDFVRLQCGLENDAYSRLVLLCISFYTNFKTGECFPSIPTLSKETNLCENTVRKRIRELEKLGFIKIKDREGSSKVISLVGYKEWLESAPKKQPVTPSRDEPLHPVNPFTSCTPPLHGMNPTPSRDEPEILNLNTTLNNSFKRVEEDSSTTSEVDETRVYFQGGNLKLCDSLNQFWLPHFQNLQGDLDLALIQISSFVNPQNKLHSLERQVSSQLSRLVRERQDRDRRYQSSKTNSSNGKATSAPAKKQSYDKNAGEFWAKVDRGEIKL